MDQNAKNWNFLYTSITFNKSETILDILKNNITRVNIVV